MNNTNILTLIEEQSKMIAESYHPELKEDLDFAEKQRRRLEIMEQYEDVAREARAEEVREEQERREFYEDHIEPMWQRGQ